MLKQLLDYGKQLFSLSGRVLKLEEDVKELRQDVKQLDREVAELNRKVDSVVEFCHRLGLELRHNTEAAAKEHEVLLLRLENTLLRFERRLPPGGPSDDQAAS